MAMQNIVGEVTAEIDFRIGSEFVLQGQSPNQPFQAVLEGTTETGYFYALDTSRPQPFQDGCLIWDMDSAEDKPYTAKIRWSADGQKALLTINDYPNAVFDFSRKEACCRTGYPPQLGPTWSPHGHDWQDNMLADFVGPPPPTPWDALADAIEPFCSMDVTIERFQEALIVNTGTEGLLIDPGRIENTFTAMRSHAPEGTVMRFANAGARVVLIASTDDLVIDAIIELRGYQQFNA